MFLNRSKLYQLQKGKNLCLFWQNHVLYQIFHLKEKNFFGENLWPWAFSMMLVYFYDFILLFLMVTLALIQCVLKMLNLFKLQISFFPKALSKIPVLKSRGIFLFKSCSRWCLFITTLAKKLKTLFLCLENITSKYIPLCQY